MILDIILIIGVGIEIECGMIGLGALHRIDGLYSDMIDGDITIITGWAMFTMDGVGMDIMEMDGITTTDGITTMDGMVIMAKAGEEATLHIFMEEEVVIYQYSREMVDHKHL